MGIRLAVFSDLHLEFEPWRPPADLAVDAVILAGDIDQGDRGLRWAEDNFPTLPVFYVAGNHEFYGQDWEDLPVELIRASQGSHVHFLENRAFSLIIKGQPLCILGATLWTGFDLAEDPQHAKDVAPQLMNDYTHIHKGDWSLTSEAVLKRHESSVAWIAHELSHIPADFTRVVVTHHAPLPRSIPEERKSHAAYYGSDLAALIDHHQPDLWIHGHIHACVDYWQGSTRIICNPRGYLGSFNGRAVVDFNPGYVIELG